MGFIVRGDPNRHGGASVVLPVLVYFNLDPFRVIFDHPGAEGDKGYVVAFDTLEQAMQVADLIPAPTEIVEVTAITPDTRDAQPIGRQDVELKEGATVVKRPGAPLRSEPTKSDADVKAQ